MNVKSILFYVFYFQDPNLCLLLFKNINTSIKQCRKLKFNICIDCYLWVTLMNAKSKIAVADVPIRRIWKQIIVNTKKIDQFIADNEK